MGSDEQELFEFCDETEIGSEGEEDMDQDGALFSDSVIWGTDWTSETVNQQLAKGNIDLFPKFQRRDAWSNVQKSKFVESIILGLPIPQLILAEKRGAKGRYIVIDGKQRLLTIRRFFVEDEEAGFIPLKLSGLEILRELNGKTFADLKEGAEFEVYLTQLENQSIRTTIIKNWPDENFLYTVFLRLNTGSLKLSPQELRQALHPGAFIDYVDGFSMDSASLKTMLNLKSPDYRMRDVELVIRHLAFKYFIETYDGNLKRFFDTTVSTLNEQWQEKEDGIKSDVNDLNEAIDFTIRIFGGRKKAFSKWNGESFQCNFNKAIFDIMTYYFSQKKIREIAAGKESEIVEAFKSLCDNDVDFLSSFEHTTKSVRNTSLRLITWGKALSKVLDIDIKIPLEQLSGGR